MRFVLLGISMFPAGCGAGASLSGRQLEAITLSPLSADAQGQTVQFTATGHWSATPVTVTPQSANWGACIGEATTAEVTVSSSGLAQCASGAKGNYTVFAFDPPLGSTGANCNAITACGGGCTISGTAQLTCP